MSRLITASEAKDKYFLKPDDLVHLHFERGGWGCGQMKLYKVEEVKSLALQKYGEEGLNTKIHAKETRLDKKRKRAEEANKVAASITSAAVPAQLSTTITNIKKSLVKQFKSKIGCVESGAPNSFRIEVPGISQELFACLVGRPTDIELKSIPKNGAYYTINMNTIELLNINSLQEIHKDVGGIDVNPSEITVLKYKPTGMLLSIHGSSEFDQF